MEEYEQIADNIKICYINNFVLNDKRYTQVSGFILNEKNQLLIVKNEESNQWGIPGGHPEEGETQIETLVREIMEEACVTIDNINYLGAVEVIEGEEKYYQLRYTAKIKDILPYDTEWETTKRLFVDIDKLNEYITYAEGTTFKRQIEAVKEFWNM